jgi:hypothetical protein
MQRTPEVEMSAGVHLVCEVCDERSIVVVPPQRAPYGIVDCPRCGSTYLVRLDPRVEPAPSDGCRSTGSPTASSLR